ncbi:uncharacterized protein LOC111374016 [Olea europaea var. sylvestris]|uniref:uncharacterized protein LOC111374016 n=1 Tax=Olea europaea var. sylvestris TaxID=158386 RepID=UPI000C1D5BDE|nr:uncharacterized protein LOC111374016 [Olea europaea var. sylvestris]XP_022852391.1 uncharacterized protein LOC111374016 [Olea europaea var. sylvestris]
MLNNTFINWLQNIDKSLVHKVLADVGDIHANVLHLRYHSNSAVNSSGSRPNGICSHSNLDSNCHSFLYRSHFWSPCQSCSHNCFCNYSTPYIGTNCGICYSNIYCKSSIWHKIRDCDDKTTARMYCDFLGGAYCNFHHSFPHCILVK